MAHADLRLIEHLQRELAAAGDPAAAESARAYLKSALPLYGVRHPEQRVIHRTAFGRYPLPDAGTWRATVLTLWREATHREERYAAIALTGHRAYADYQVPAVLPVYEELVVTGAWWDLVDDVAIRRVGPILLAYPDEIRPVMRDWSRDPDMWKRRSAIICQIKARAGTDLALLHECVEVNAGDREFFVRKALGWALREYAKTDPDHVRSYVEAHPELSALSRREALKNL